MRNAPTPWGRAQHATRLDTGAWWVSTAGHGGLMVSRGWAREHLDPEAIKRAIPFGSWLAYEEDCDWAIVGYTYPELFTREASFLDPTPKASAFKTLSSYHADYLRAIGVEPDPKGAARFDARKLQEKMRGERHPDLIVSAVGDWHENVPTGTVQVKTADGQTHLVYAGSYQNRSLEYPNLLSTCVIYPIPDLVVILSGALHEEQKGEI